MKAAKEINADMLVTLIDPETHIGDYIMGNEEQKIVANEAQIPVLCINLKNIIDRTGEIFLIYRSTILFANYFTAIIIKEFLLQIPLYTNHNYMFSHRAKVKMATLPSNLTESNEKGVHSNQRADFLKERIACCFIFLTPSQLDSEIILFS
ncbi:MAG: hypothetical protein IPP29_06810 [Bacteroidetes bacterium]|nr:hypothetical protein [Bacteroidota bacterium]